MTAKVKVMSEDNTHINYSAADIEKYHRGGMPAADMHAMEKAALDDPFLADAIEGYEARSTKPAYDDIENLKKRLTARITEKQTAQVIQFPWWKVAAVVFLVAGAGLFYITINSNLKLQNIAKNVQVNKIIAVPAKQDSTVADLALNEKKQAGAGTVSSSYKIKKASANSAYVAPGDGSSIAKNKDRKENSSKIDSRKAAAPAPATSTVARATEKEPVRPADTTTSGQDAFAMTAKKKAGSKPVAAALSDKAAGISVDSYTVNNASPSTSANIMSNTFNGTIVDASNRPLANAIIQIPNLNIATVTDNKGYFSFKAADTILNASVASVGFETQNIELTTNSIDDENVKNIIRLKPSLINLNEVAATGYARQKKKDVLEKTNNITIRILDAEPSGGWNEYTLYLEKNKKIPGEVKDIHGDVVVSFTVNTKSRLQHFSIEKSLVEKLDAEAIRLIKEGPSWKLLKGKKARIAVTVKF